MQVSIAAVLATLVVYVLVDPRPDPEPRPVAQVVTAADKAEWCDAMSRQARVMAKAVTREFRRHMAAHRAYTRKENPIPFGPVTNPKSVLAIWKDTMHKGAMHARHYDELDALLRQRGCPEVVVVELGAAPA